MTASDDEHFMREALKLAQRAADLGEVPVGAVVVADGQVIGRGFNSPISDADPTAHAELQALRDAAKQRGNYRLPETTLYVTIEPCTMCAGAIVHARIARLVYGASEEKSGVACSQEKIFDKPYFNHQVTVQGGVLGPECADLISGFFRQRRQQRRRDREQKP